MAAAPNRTGAGAGTAVVAGMTGINAARWLVSVALHGSLAESAAGGALSVAGLAILCENGTVVVALV